MQATIREYDDYCGS